MRIPSERLGPWLVAGTVAWVGLAWIGWTLWQSTPPRAGFDLTLLLQAARHVLDGQSPYDPAMVAGISPDATELFYSYPPPVAQAMTLVAWLPDGLALVAWAAGATAALGLAGASIARAAGARGLDVAVRMVAVAPLVLPFGIAILFGNLDAWYPLAYGALLLSALPGASRRTQVIAGVAVAAATVAKLHPAPLLVWVAVVAIRERGGPQARVLAAAATTGLAIVGVSLVIGGLGPWQDYVAVVRAGAGAGLVDPRNAGPVSLLGQLTGAEQGTLQAAQAVVTLSVLVVTVLAASRVRDPVASVAIASAASLMTLPVTWYHNPTALIPLAILLVLSSSAARARVALAVIVVDVAIAFLPLLWLAVGVLLAACTRAVRRVPLATDPVAAA
jgi:hypothetical protein